MFAFVGGGAGKVEVERRIAAGAKNLRSLPYQPRDQLQETLAAADVHVVSMGNDMVGIVHPCKIYGVMAVGRPILFFGPLESHVGQLVGPNPLGWHVNHGDVRATITALTEVGSMAAANRHWHQPCTALTSSVVQLSRAQLECFCDILQYHRPCGAR